MKWKEEFENKFVIFGYIDEQKPDKIIKFIEKIIKQREKQFLKDTQRWTFMTQIGTIYGEAVPFHAIIDAVDNPRLFESKK